MINECYSVEFASASILQQKLDIKKMQILASTSLKCFLFKVVAYN